MGRDTWIRNSHQRPRGGVGAVGSERWGRSGGVTAVGSQRWGRSGGAGAVGSAVGPERVGPERCRTHKAMLGKETHTRVLIWVSLVSRHEQSVACPLVLTGFTAGKEDEGREGGRSEMCAAYAD